LWGIDPIKNNVYFVMKELNYSINKNFPLTKSNLSVHFSLISEFNTVHMKKLCLIFSNLETDMFWKYFLKSNASNTLFWALSLALTLLLGKIIVCPTTICGFHFQSVGPTLISPNKRVSARESAQKRVLLTFLFFEYEKSQGNVSFMSVYGSLGMHLLDYPSPMD